MDGHLVIARRIGESVVLTTLDGTEIRVSVYEADRGQCRLGIKAPHTVAILRDNAKRAAPPP
jgi:carbon storage regulator CsrA